MRFATKLSLVISSLLCVALSLGGTWTIQENFRQMETELLHQCSREQLYDQYALDTKLSREEETKSIATLAAEYAREKNAVTSEEPVTFTLLGENGSILFSNLPREILYADQQDAIRAGETKALFRHRGESYYLLLATPLRGLEEKVWMVNVYNATHPFQERNRQIRQHLGLQLAAMTLTGVAAVLISKLLTRSIEKLEVASKAIAKGEPGVRVKISSRDELEELGIAFNRMANTLESQMTLLREETQRQKRFVSAFTHELKTPMTAILGYSSLLRGGEMPLDQRRKSADYIYHESCRLENLCQELLLLLGLEKGEMHWETVKVSALYREVCRSLPESSLPVLWEGEKELKVMADRVLLVTLLRNLILNGEAADPKDGKITFRTSSHQGKVALAVEDHGRGIPQEELARITEPFYRVDKSRARNKGGNGLGLSICAMIAQLHGSELQIESQEGEGTKVWIYLKEVKD